MPTTKKSSSKNPAKVTKKVAAKKTTKAAKTAKKSVSKSVTQKQTTTGGVKKASKKVDAKAIAKRPIEAVIAPEHAFWVRNGVVLHSLVELETALMTMPSVVYNHHVRPEQNDFAEWVEHVLGLPTCAAELRKANNPRSAERVVAKAVKHAR